MAVRCSFQPGEGGALDCACDAGFSGPDCSLECKVGRGSTCSGRGACVAGQCACADGWGGEACEVLAPVPLRPLPPTPDAHRASRLAIFAMVALPAAALAVGAGYVANLRAGKQGPDALPLFDYYMKTLRSAPDFGRPAGERRFRFRADL